MTRPSCVATGFLGMLGDLGHDRDFLCLDRSLLGPVSRPGVVKIGRPCVATKQVCDSCRNRLFWNQQNL